MAEPRLLSELKPSELRDIRDALLLGSMTVKEIQRDYGVSSAHFGHHCAVELGIYFERIRRGVKWREATQAEIEYSERELTRWENKPVSSRKQHSIQSVSAQEIAGLTKAKAAVGEAFDEIAPALEQDDPDMYQRVTDLIEWLNRSLDEALQALAKSREARLAIEVEYADYRKAHETAQEEHVDVGAE